MKGVFVAKIGIKTRGELIVSLNEAQAKSIMEHELQEDLINWIVLPPNEFHLDHIRVRVSDIDYIIVTPPND
jgi:hypothetical protein